MWLLNSGNNNGNKKDGGGGGRPPTTTAGRSGDGHARPLLSHWSRAWLLAAAGPARHRRGPRTHRILLGPTVPRRVGRIPCSARYTRRGPTTRGGRGNRTRRCGTRHVTCPPALYRRRGGPRGQLVGAPGRRVTTTTTLRALADRFRRGARRRSHPPLRTRRQERSHLSLSLLLGARHASCEYEEKVALMQSRCPQRLTNRSPGTVWGERWFEVRRLQCLPMGCHLRRRAFKVWFDRRPFWHTEFNSSGAVTKWINTRTKSFFKENKRKASAFLLHAWDQRKARKGCPVRSIREPTTGSHRVPFTWVQIGRSWGASLSIMSLLSMIGYTRIGSTEANRDSAVRGSLI